MFLRHLILLKSIQILVTYMRLHLDFRPLPWSLTFNWNQSYVNIKKCYLPSHLNILRQPVSQLPSIVRLPNKPPAIEKRVFLKICLQHVSHFKETLVEEDLLKVSIPSLNTQGTIHSSCTKCLLGQWRQWVSRSPQRWLMAIKLNITTKYSNLRLPKRNVGSHPSF